MSSSICNSILLKSSFKNRGILLNNFKITIFCCIVCKLGANAHFIPKACAIYNETIDLRIHNVIIESTSKNYIDAIATIKSSPSMSWETKIKQWSLCPVQLCTGYDTIQTCVLIISCPGHKCTSAHIGVSLVHKYTRHKPYPN